MFAKTRAKSQRPLRTVKKAVGVGAVRSARAPGGGVCQPPW